MGNEPLPILCYIKHMKKPISPKPVHNIPKHERWLFEPQNKELLKRLKKSLKQEANIDLGSFKQYLTQSSDSSH